jgi:hypothetical protein
MSPLLSRKNSQDTAGILGKDDILSGVDRSEIQKNIKIAQEHRLSLPSVNLHNPLKIKSLNAAKPTTYSTLRKLKVNDDIVSHEEVDSEP